MGFKKFMNEQRKEEEKNPFQILSYHWIGVKRTNREAKVKPKLSSRSTVAIDADKV